MTTTEKRLTKILEKHFGLFPDEELLKSCIHKDLHFDDLEFMDMITRIEMEFNIKIDDEKIFLKDRFGIITTITVQELVNYVDEKLKLKPKKSVLTKLKNTLSKIWWCNICNWHNWTSIADQEIKPQLNENSTPEEQKRFINDSLKMWCKRCNKESELSKKWRAKLNEEL